MKISLQSLFIIIFLLNFNLPSSAQKKLKVNVDYIEKYSKIAVKHRDQYKIPASITLSQGILESGAGLSELAKASNNHFGIKCHSGWTGERIYRKDDGPNDCFRKYKKVEDSYEDHAKFLANQPRYSILFTYDIKDYRAWAKGLQTCGYATDKGYANKLIQLIEIYELYEYDSKTPLKTIKPIAKEKKKKPELLRDVYRAYNLLYIIAKDDDNLTQIADDTGFKVKNLIKYNEIPENFPLRKGDIVYLEKKKKKADLPNFEHLVKVGESMHSISQLYGIQLKSLYKMNKKGQDYTPTEEDVLRLR